jgi:hypothetical protein
VCVCVRACVYVWVWVHGRMSVCVCTCACDITYPACKAFAPYYIVMCRLHLFIYIISKRERFSERRLFDIKFVFWYSLQFLFEIFLTLIRIQRDMAMNVGKSSYKMLVFFFSDFIKTGIFSTEFRKKLKYKISSKSVL